MGDYITSIGQLLFPNGNLIKGYMDSDISEEESNTALAALITKSEIWVNNQLKGKTAIPGVHIDVELQEIALEYARFLVLRDNAVFEKNDKEPISNLYLENARQLLKDLRYGASASVPVASSQNAGNGVMSSVTVDDRYTLKEGWIIRSIGGNDFEVYGSLSGALYSYDPNEGVYPNQYDAERIPDSMRRISFTITEGDIAFVAEDEFTFNTYSPSWMKLPIISIPVRR